MCETQSTIDTRIIAMHNQGYSLREIAEVMANIDVVYIQDVLTNYMN